MIDFNNFDGLYVTNTSNKRYMTGFTGSTSEVIILKDKVVFITDGRYSEQVKSELFENIEVKIVSSIAGYEQLVLDVIKENNITKLGVESNFITRSKFVSLSNQLPEVQLVDTTNVIETLRVCKNDDEIALMQKACDITDKTFTDLIEFVKPGLTELQVKQFLDLRQQEYGAQMVSFDPIVASGANAAKPHGHATENVIKDGDIITIDFGCFYKGYSSDMTRTFFVGTPKEEKLVEIYDIVKEAYLIGEKMCAPGVKCSDVDKAVRDYITDKGYGDYFNHGLGHSLGLDVHENPRFTAVDDTVLKVGMVMTVEPGIYLPGLGGCRLENDILITETGYRILNNSEMIKQNNPS